MIIGQIDVGQLIIEVLDQLVMVTVVGAANEGIRQPCSRLVCCGFCQVTN